MIKSTIGIVSPYGSTNYVLNPSGETTGNFSLQGSATVTRVTTYQKYGLYSYQIAITASGGGINLTLSSLSNAPNYVSFRIKKPEAVKLNVTIGSATKEARFLERIDAEWSLFWAAFSAAEASGQTNLRITQLGAGTNTIYLDGAQVEPNKLTTYIDGTQEGCRWNGTAHGSTSTRSADSRAGGIVKDFWQDYGFFPEKVLGAGAVVEDLNIDSYAFLPGGELNSSKIQPREFTIIGFFLGNTKEDLHAKAQALELELGLDTYPGRQPVRIRYFGAAVQKEISAHYTGGLEGELPIFYNDEFSVEDEQWMKHYEFRMKASIQFKALDPFWYEVGESAAELETGESDTFVAVAARLLEGNSMVWSNLGPPDPATSVNLIHAIVEDDTYIYIGGEFDNFDNIAAGDNIIRYNKQTGVYSAMDVGLNAPVWALAFSPAGDLYVGGEFTNASGVAAADYLAVWVSGGTSFQAVGVPLTGAAAIVLADALLFDSFGNLIIGGNFSNWNNIAAADGIVQWNPTTSTYTALGSGFNGTVLSLALGNGVIYAGGSFSASGATPITRIGQWNYSSWSQLGPGLDNTVFSMVVAPNFDLYLGGSFTETDDASVTLNGIARWNGQVFIPLGTGTDGDVYSVAFGKDNLLYLTGPFEQAGSLTITDRLATWNGSSYGTISLDLPGTSVKVIIYVSGTNFNPVVPSNYQLYLGFGPDTGTGTYSENTDVTNEGTISVFPKIIFSRSGGDAAIIKSIRNERINRVLLFDYSLVDGETLTIDLNPRNRTIVSSFFGSRMDAVLANSDFSTWQLLPRDNTISTLISEEGSPTVTGHLLYRTPYKSWN